MPPDGVTITLRDVWLELSRLSESVAGVPSSVKDHELRVRSLERSRWQLAAAMAVIGFIGGNAFPILGAIT